MFACDSGTSTGSWIYGRPRQSKVLEALPLRSGPRGQPRNYSVSNMPPGSAAAAAAGQEQGQLGVETGLLVGAGLTAWVSKGFCVYES